MQCPLLLMIVMTLPLINRKSMFNLPCMFCTLKYVSIQCLFYIWNNISHVRAHTYSCAFIHLDRRKYK